MPCEQGGTSTSRRPSSSSIPAALVLLCTADLLDSRAGRAGSTLLSSLPEPTARQDTRQRSAGLGITAAACLIPSDPEHFGRTKSRVSFASKLNLRFQGLEALQSLQHPASSSKGMYFSAVEQQSKIHTNKQCSRKPGLTISSSERRGMFFLKGFFFFSLPPPFQFVLGYFF